MLAPATHPVASTMVIVLCVFLIGALWIAVGEARAGRGTTGAWRMFAVQLLVTSWLLIPISLGPTWFRLSLIATAIVVSWELYRAVERLGLPVRTMAGIAISTLYVGLACLPDPTLWSAAPVCFGLALLGAAVFGRDLDGAYSKAALTFFGSIYPGLCLSFAARIPDFGNAFGDVVFLYAVLELNDAFAFLAGKYWGERKIAPLLSPNKTVTGSVAGIGAAILGAAALSFLQPDFSLAACMALGGILAVLGQIADLAASSIKRQAGIKDYSRFADAQGGVLDLYDAFIFCAPIWFLFLSLMRTPLP